MITGQQGIKYGLQIPTKKQNVPAKPPPKAALQNVFGDDDDDDEGNLAKELEKHQAKKRSDAKVSWLIERLGSVERGGEERVIDCPSFLLLVFLVLLSWT